MADHSDDPNELRLQRDIARAEVLRLRRVLRRVIGGAHIDDATLRRVEDALRQSSNGFEEYTE